LKTLGIIGGLGPESTVDYYQTIIALYRQRTGDGSYPQFLINSVDLNEGRNFVIADDRQGLTEMIVNELDKLVRAGAHFGLIAANTPHLVFDEIAARSSIPLISIVEATCAAAKDRQFNRLAIFGTKFTMTGDFYSKVFSRHGIELVQPDSADQDYIHDKYMNELVAGKFLPETRASLLAIVDRMKRKIDIDAVILAGTELPLILRDAEHNGIPFLNTTTIHCEAAVAEMLAK
jgi:aspartate racemase